LKKTDIIAWMLAARHDSSIEELPEYREARRLVEASSNLRAVIEKEKAYYEENADYLDFVRLPDDVKQRMKDRIRIAVQAECSDIDPQPIIGFPWRPWLAAASVAILLAIGIAASRMVGSSEVVEVSPSQGASIASFQQFAVDQVEAGFDLDYDAPSTEELMSWLDKSGAPADIDLDDRFQALESMGCKIFDWDGRPVSLICFRVDEDMVHLFVTDASRLSSVGSAQAPGFGQISGRDTMCWRTNDHAFVLVAHKQGQELSPFSS